MYGLRSRHRPPVWTLVALITKRGRSGSSWSVSWWNRWSLYAAATLSPIVLRGRRMPPRIDGCRSSCPPHCAQASRAGTRAPGPRRRRRSRAAPSCGRASPPSASRLRRWRPGRASAVGELVQERQSAPDVEEHRAISAAGQAERHPDPVARGRYRPRWQPATSRRASSAFGTSNLLSRPTQMYRTRGVEWKSVSAESSARGAPSPRPPRQQPRHPGARGRAGWPRRPRSCLAGSTCDSYRSPLFAAHTDPLADGDAHG